MATDKPTPSQNTDMPHGHPVAQPAELTAEEIAQVGGGAGKFVNTSIGTARPLVNGPDFRSAH